MENNNSDKIRVNTYTKIDDSEEKLLDEVFWSSLWIILFFVFSIGLKIHFFAFALFIYFFSFKFQKNLLKNKNKYEKIKELFLINNDNLKNKYSIHLGTLVKKHKKDVDVLTLYNQVRKFFGFDYEIEKTIPSQKLTSSKSNAITPVLIDDAILRQHCALMATTGGGKTELLLNSYIESSISKGSGVFAIFGKADNSMLQRVQSICATFNRLSDLHIVNWNPDKRGKFNSNTINLFELGASKDIITMLTSIADLEGNDDGSWNGKAKLFLSSLLKVILTLRDANFFLDISKIDKVFNSTNKFEEYQKHLVKLDYFSFNRLLSETDLLIKFLLIFDEIYETNKNEINTKLYSKFIKIIEVESKNNSSLSHLDSSVKNQFHNELKNVVIMLSNVPDWEKLKETYLNGVVTESGTTIKGIEAVSLKYPQRSGTFYDLSVAQGLMDKLVNFFDSFAPILKNVNSDLNILDAIDSNKIVIVNLPGQNKIYSPILAELLVSTLNLLAERRGKDFIPDTTTLVILDEINSWLKTKNNQSYQIGDLLSVIRGLYMGAVLSFQSDLKETMGSIDNSQIIANVKTIISLKLEDVELIKLLNSKVQKVEKITLEESMKREKNLKKSHNNEDSKLSKSEEDFFKPEMLSNIKNGEGYIIKNSIASPFMAKYMKQKSLYKTAKDDVVLNRYVDVDVIIKKQIELGV
ncbi:hypothetical protein AVENP_2625 [Arcobacter venerupis]|uniref:TraD/TraG TraM recognition site domain-containing protein n=1 Tax=Arcobacter venerupis TaxID=1054033 RepID=A0AAE7BBM1_9BACT|nr:hypothetical protein [Arcobacter venerupis]QKF68121.1 hypothetical protein AVENP_2625 [Arcobacter venerupis]RWS48874.1 hypothetical protein CKA56_12110 [Arcobacter venerupis]